MKPPGTAPLPPQRCQPSGATPGHPGPCHRPGQGTCYWQKVLQPNPTMPLHALLPCVLLDQQKPLRPPHVLLLRVLPCWQEPLQALPVTVRLRSCYEMPACHRAVPATGCCDTVQVASSCQAPSYCRAPSHCEAPSAAEPCSVTPPDCNSSVTASWVRPALIEVGLPTAIPTLPVQGFGQCLQEPSTPPVSGTGCTVPMAWSSPELQSHLHSYQHPLLPHVCQDCLLLRPSGPALRPAPPIQPSRDVPVSPTQPPGTSLGNGSPEIPEDMIPRSKAAVPSAPPLPELELSLEYIPARDAGDTSRESQTHHPFVEHCI